MVLANPVLMKRSDRQREVRRGTDESAASFVIEAYQCVGDEQESDLERDEGSVTKGNPFNDFDQIVGAFNNSV